MDPMNGYWLVPTRNRATTNLPKLLRMAVDAGMTTPGLVIVDSDDWEANREAYDRIDLPAFWDFMIVPGGSLRDSMEQAREKVMRQYPDLGWLGFLADDHQCETQFWDTKTIERLKGWNVVSTDDGAKAPKKMEGAIAWSCDLIRAVGYFFAPGLKHFYLDDVWEEIGRATGCWQVDMDIMVRHDHVLYRRGNKDSTTRHTESFWINDDKAFRDWTHNDRLPACERVIELMIKHGAANRPPDLKGVSLLIATPCGQGNYERVYLRSFMNTVTVLRQFGATVDFADLPYCSDPSLARCKLFGTFYRSNYTHMLQIDDDMGWSAHDVVRLLMFDREFIAASGIKKMDPREDPQFTINMVQDDGTSMPIRQERHTGLLEVSEVGGAFVLIKHSVAEKMVAAYPEFQFDTPEGRVEYALYTPLVTARRYMSEDFAFCYRWRKIGGHVQVLPDVRLKHVGKFTWDAALVEGFEAELRSVPEKLLDVAAE